MRPGFWNGKNVLLTGHTGFKGGWLSLWLQGLGAEVTGYSLAPTSAPSLFELAKVEHGMASVHGDVLDLPHLRRVMRESSAEIAFHLAAQSLVRRSYADPAGTYATNVMGTANLLEAARGVPAVRAVVVVTSDKCYENREDGRAYVETDRLGGGDPYSSSKACAEHVTAAWRKAFFSGAAGGSKAGVASARAGNVIGGGDWAEDRLIPDVMRAARQGKPAAIRNPNSVRPWQHVLDPLCGYLELAERVWEEPARFSEAWNFGPEEVDCVPVAAVLDRLSALWGPGLAWRSDDGPHPHEARSLRLDCSKAKRELGWAPAWPLEQALEATAEWYKAYLGGGDVRAVTEQQIHRYQSRLKVAETSQR